MKKRAPTLPPTIIDRGLSMIAMRVTFSRACAHARKKKSDIICARKCAQMRARESEEDMRKKCVLDTDTKFVFVFFGTFSAKKFETHHKNILNTHSLSLLYLSS